MSSVSISHVAAAVASIQSISPKPVLEMWWSMFTIGTRPNSSAFRPSTGPMRSRLAAVADHDQVIVERWIWILLEPIDARHEVVHMRHRISAHRRGPSTELLDRKSQSESRAECIGLRVLVAYGEHSPSAADPADHVGHGTRRRRRRECQGDVSDVIVVVFLRRFGFGSGSGASADTPVGVGRVSGRCGTSPSPPRSSSSRIWRMRVPWAAVWSSLTCSAGIRLRRSLPSRCRTNGIAWVSARRVWRFSSSRADDRNPHVGMAAGPG